MALNPKQILFVKEYILDQNATRAAKAAGYSDKTAYSQGQRLLKHVEIAPLIKKAFADQVKTLEKKAARKGITKERWLDELSLIAFANMDDYARVEEMHYRNGTRGKKVNFKGVNAVPAKDRHRSLGRAIKKISETKNGIGIELHSKQASLELIGKHFGWVKNEVSLVPGEGGAAKVIITIPSNGREAKKTPDPGKDGADE